MFCHYICVSFACFFAFLDYTPKKGSSYTNTDRQHFLETDIITIIRLSVASTSPAHPTI